MLAFIVHRLEVLVLFLLTAGVGPAQVPRDPGEAAYAGGLQLLAAVSTSHLEAAFAAGAGVPVLIGDRRR